MHDLSVTYGSLDKTVGIQMIACSGHEVNCNKNCKNYYIVST